ncbi:MAG: hypothetical protein NTU98_09080 [Bacteroidetes bacterium]|nr:hypothetical protein [Bacteroidota bacterium]
MNDVQRLSELVLAPYVLHATTLISNPRKVGGNAFRHCFATLGILLDYKYFRDPQGPVLLKASLLHDLLEDVPSTSNDLIRALDTDGPAVVELVLEVTKTEGEDKEVYLRRILEEKSHYAKVLKVADRISNLTDLNRDVYSDQKISDYLDQTEKYVLPMAHIVNQDMVKELSDLIEKRRTLLRNETTHQEG